MTNEKGNVISISNKCCCCGGVVAANYKKGDEVARAFAEACDVCTECFKAGCRVLTGDNCRVASKRQVQLESDIELG